MSEDAGREVRVPLPPGEWSTAEAYGGVVARWREKLADVEAVRYTGDNADEIISWVNGSEQAPASFGYKGRPAYLTGRKLSIRSYGPSEDADPGDWVVLTPEGFRTCTDALFRQRYRQAGEQE